MESQTGVETVKRGDQKRKLEDSKQEKKNQIKFFKKKLFFEPFKKKFQKNSKRDVFYSEFPFSFSQLLN